MNEEIRSAEKSKDTSADKAQDIMGKIRDFFREVGAEFHRTTWPRGRELMESTAVVLIFIVLLSGTVLVFDKLIAWALGLIYG